MTKSRKKKGGQEVPKSACEMPGMEGLCPKITENGGSLMATTKAGIALTQKTNKMQVCKYGFSQKVEVKEKKEEVAVESYVHNLQLVLVVLFPLGLQVLVRTCVLVQSILFNNHASSTYDKQAKSLDINPPCDPFSGSCPSSGGGKRKRRRKKRKTRRRKKRKTRRRRKRKTRRRRKSRKHRS